MNTTSSNSTAKHVREKVLRSADRFWTTADLVGVGGTGAAAASELHRLAAAGELEHVRRGLWWRGHESRFGKSLPRQGVAVRELIGNGEAVGAGEWQATNLLGLSTQVSPVDVLAVTSRP